MFEEGHWIFVWVGLLQNLAKSLSYVSLLIKETDAPVSISMFMGVWLSSTVTSNGLADVWDTLNKG